MNKNSLRGEGMLLITALIWGTAFVAQHVGINYIGPFTFNASRMFIGGFTLLPCIYLFGNRNSSCKKKEQSVSIIHRLSGNSKLIIGGVLCGIILYIAGGFQQVGIMYTSVSKAGFITALYIILVPILGIFLKKRPNATLWISVLLALCGMYLLCITDGFQIAIGDIFVILSAFFFSLHILAIDYYSSYVNGVKLACIQFFVCGALSAVTMFLFETPQLTCILQAWVPILYTGIMSCGIAYTFQILGQRDVNPVVASLIMSLESVFSALAGWILLGESLSTKELFGCILVFAAIILAQLPITSYMKKSSLDNVPEE